MKNKKIINVPSGKEASFFMEQALKKKTELSEPSKKLLTQTVLSLYNMRLIKKELLDKYLRLTKSGVRNLTR